MSNQDYKYDIALSFAGEDREYAEKLAQVLTSLNIRVFYDEYEEATLWGKNLYTHLSEVYQKEARFCVMFLSQNYAQKLWTNHERGAAQARAFIQENKEYILPIRLDDTEIAGILSTIGYLKWSNADSIAQTIFEKLEQENESQRKVSNITKKSHFTQLPSFDQILKEQMECGEHELAEIKVTSDIPVIGDEASEVGEDYTQLRELLNNQKFGLADLLTTRLMLRVARQEQEGWFLLENLLHFPKKDIVTINRLWVSGSKGRFGFSVQKQIWMDLVRDSKKENGYGYDEILFFFNKVEWGEEKRIIFEQRAEVGHLPLGIYVSVSNDIRKLQKWRVATDTVYEAEREDERKRWEEEKREWERMESGENLIIPTKKIERTRIIDGEDYIKFLQSLCEL